MKDSVNWLTSSKDENGKIDFQKLLYCRIVPEFLSLKFLYRHGLQSLKQMMIEYQIYTEKKS